MITAIAFAALVVAIAALTVALEVRRDTRADQIITNVRLDGLKSSLDKCKRAERRPAYRIDRKDID